MAVTTLEAAAAIQSQHRHLVKSHCSRPLKVLAVTNAVVLAAAVTAIAMPGLVQDLLEMVGLPANSLLRQIDLREPFYMGFALVWVLAVFYLHVDEINEQRLALRSAAETEMIRAFTVEDLLAHLARAAALLIPSYGLYLFPHYLHAASGTDHAVFTVAFALQFLLWRASRRE